MSSLLNFLRPLALLLALPALLSAAPAPSTEPLIKLGESKRPELVAR